MQLAKFTKGRGVGEMNWIMRIMVKGRTLIEYVGGGWACSGLTSALERVHENVESRGAVVTLTLFVIAFQDRRLAPSLVAIIYRHAATHQPPSHTGTLCE